jgi:hypothetical protein
MYKFDLDAILLNFLLVLTIRMIRQIIKQRYLLVISRFVSVFLHSNKVAAADESPPVLAHYRISRSDSGGADRHEVTIKLIMF